MYDKFGIKELYEVSIKTTDNMTINNRQYEADEVFMYFEELQIANISAESDVREASGGKDNFPLIIWDKVSAVDFIFEDGLLAMSGLNLNSQSRAFATGATKITVPRRETGITSGTGTVTLDYAPATSRSMFAYKTSGSIITDKLTIIGATDKTLDLGVGNANISVLIDYYFEDDNITYYEIGGENIKGFFKVTSKINVVDGNGGVKTTMLFVMPKVKIMSTLNLTLGVRANPIVSTFRMRALSDGKTLARFIYLNQDIEG